MLSTPPSASVATGQSSRSIPDDSEGLGEAVASGSFVSSSAASSASSALSVASCAASPALSGTSPAAFSAGFCEASSPFSSVFSSAGADDEAEADGLGLGVSSAFSPGVKTSLMASPICSSRFLSVSDGDGAGSVSAACPPAVAEGVGAGSALSSEPESGEESDPLPASFCGASSAGAEPLGSAEGSLSSSEALSLAVADGVGDALASPFSAFSMASRHSLNSSAVRFLDDGWSSAWASVGVKPIPIRTAVGIAAMAIAFPAGMWSLVNSGFLGAACRGPVLTRDASTSAPWVTSSAGTVPPVRPVRRARS